MNTPSQEKRLSERIFFPPEDNFSGNFLFTPESKTPLKAYIMDLSLLGIGITMIKEKFPPVERNETITLSSVNDSGDLSFLQNTELEIRWILNHRSLEHVALGCAFIRLSPSIEEKIIQFIAEWKYNSQ